MATNKVEIEGKNQELKYLGFVKIAAINALMCLWNLYENTKQNCGPLRSGFNKVEGTVTTVISPVCEKFKNFPHDLLLFVDNKLDEAAHKFEDQVPILAKQVANQSWVMVQKASKLTQATVSETQTKGLPRAAIYAVNNLEKYPMEQAAKTWYKLNQVATLKMVAEMMIYTAGHWSDKYNQFIVSMTKKGYFGFSFLPLLPVDKIAKAFEVRKEDDVKPQL